MLSHYRYFHYYFFVSFWERYIVLRKTSISAIWFISRDQLMCVYVYRIEGTRNIKRGRTNTLEHTNNIKLKTKNREKMCRWNGHHQSIDEEKKKKKRREWNRLAFFVYRIGPFCSELSANGMSSSSWFDLCFHFFYIVFFCLYSVPICYWNRSSLIYSYTPSLPAIDNRTARLVRKAIKSHLLKEFVFMDEAYLPITK